MPTLTDGELTRMRGAHTSQLFGARCTIKRFDESGTDPYGQPDGQWITHLEDVPCWYDPTATQGMEMTTEGPNVNALTTGRRLKVPSGTDVKPTDRIASITHVDGHTVVTSLKIHEVRTYIAGITLFCEEQEPS